MLDYDGHWECPDCGGDRFSWLVTDVQVGPIMAMENEDGSHTQSHIPQDNGPVVSSETDPVMCTNCDEEIDADDLVFVKDEEDETDG